MESVRTISRRWGVLLALLGWAEMGWAGDPAYDPPAGYYEGTAELLGSSLQGVLNGKIKGHRVIAYGSSGTVPALRVLDAMPGNATQVNLIYWGTGRAASNYGGNNGQWNHEHCLPQSYGVSSGAGNSDLFNLRPADVQANNERGNLYFAEISGGTVPSFSPLCRKTSVAWMPRPEEKGMLARAMFYMAVRYDGGETTPDLKLSDTPNASANTFGRLSDLLVWHRQYPVTEEERLRNHTIYTSYQFNRNPFVDDPDYAELVFRGVPVVRVAAVRSQAVEGGTGTNAAAMLVSRRGPLSNALTVTLSYGGTSGTNVLAAAPMTVTIPAGTNAVEVVLAAASNAGTQGERTLTVGAATNVAYAPVDGAVTLTVTDAPESGLSSWISGYGLSGTDAAATADPDGDGYVNLAEYALGGNPTLATGGLGPTVSMTNTNGTNGLRFAYRARTNDGVLVIQPVFKASLTETNWSTNGVVQKVSGQPAGDGVHEDQVWQTPIGSEARRFLRLNISR